jgi:hypothetical protein
MGGDRWKIAITCFRRPTVLAVVYVSNIGWNDGARGSFRRTPWNVNYQSFFDGLSTWIISIESPAHWLLRVEDTL